ncbi:saccharopine dehydrogenase NADP-binding domain-containing protein [Actinomycetospora atypica]|uniref:Saccharopine dehydrogenase NADP-binding domain-containing protein n=1 Tax=Actinomycetospora atypica TaxID=1290095 RepID=A0ABV9YPE2_9PSEU
MADTVWVLGSSGRTGRGIARALHARGVPLVLAGRSAARLAGLAAELDAEVREGPLEEILGALGRAAPGVVVNTVGPFTTTAPAVARACPPGTHYVDVANELSAFESLLALDAVVARERRTVVTGAGFGVVAGEGVVLDLVADRPAPERVRVAVLPSVAAEEGTVGAALAGTIVGQLPEGGRTVRDGRMVRSAPVGATEVLTTPDGDEVPTTAAPFGELLAAWRASGAREVVAASSLAPSGLVVRLVTPVAGVLLRVPGATTLATSALARVPMRAAERPRPHSWAHARATWADGSTDERWLRLGDAMDVTVAAAAGTTMRLLGSTGRPGAFLPGALFGTGLALEAGGVWA